MASDRASYPSDEDAAPGPSAGLQPRHDGDDARQDERQRQEVASTATTTSFMSCLRDHVPGHLGHRILGVTVVLAAALFLGASQSHDGDGESALGGDGEEGLGLLGPLRRPRRFLSSLALNDLASSAERWSRRLLTGAGVGLGLGYPASAPPARAARERGRDSATGTAAAAFIAECSGPTVSTRQGLLCGRLARSGYGRAAFAYYAFQGIPYARPPLGELRFKDPEPALPWEGVRRAVRTGATCLQSGQGAIVDSLSPTLRQAFLLVRAIPNFLTRLTSGRQQSEDCLFLNVYTRQVSPSRLQPVMVWFHGGGFHMGSGDTDLYGPDYLLEPAAADEGVVLVTLNYRLGPLGFLSVPAAGVPGNAGLKDQAAALRWVRDNIAVFGGDPDRVTIFGESAGGTSVQMHMLSPVSRGLFHAAISQSGSALNPRSSTTEGRERAHRLARALGIEARDDADMVRRLQQLPATMLTAKSESVLTPAERSRGLAVHPFVPSVEATDGSFLPGEPQELLARGDVAAVPYISGVNSLEAGFMFRKGRDSANLGLDAEVEKLVPSDLGVAYGSADNAELARRMRRAYFGDSEPPTELQLAEMYSDLFVGWVVHRTINLFSRRESPPFYVYYFYHDGGLCFSQRLLDKNLPGVYHGDELGYLFTQEVVPSGEESEEDRLVRYRMVKLWTNFAATGDPNGRGRSPLLPTEWLPANNQSQLYLEIGPDMAMRRGSPLSRAAFWDSVYAEAYGGRRL